MIQILDKLFAFLVLAGLLVFVGVFWSTGR